jgi:hypothetical protein
MSVPRSLDIITRISEQLGSSHAHTPPPPHRCLLPPVGDDTTPPSLQAKIYPLDFRLRKERRTKEAFLKLFHSRTIHERLWGELTRTQPASKQAPSRAIHSRPYISLVSLVTRAASAAFISLALTPTERIFAIYLFSAFSSLPTSTAAARRRDQPCPISRRL